ncbi:MAG: hypothetical protein OWU84_02855 [Firmicutes bacterium]|nr:hypothetical protein [Bacillota bacterium]
MERHERLAVIVDKFFHEKRDTNPYASAETMRALDHLVRIHVTDAMARAAAQWRAVYVDASRAMGTPTRTQPLSNVSAMSQSRLYKQLADRLSEWVARIQALPAPANDRVYHRIRDNDQLLELLIAHDYQLITLAEQLERESMHVTLDSAEALRPTVETLLKTLTDAVMERNRMLSAVP